MLSILIPIYNHKVVKLVKELVTQCGKCNIGFEVICLDDKSNQKYRDHNQEINAWLGVNYVELSENIGRTKIRNRLAMLARYDWLLLLDADVRLRSKRFIKRYLEHLKEENDAVVGGISYLPKPPKAQSKVLHWTYGSKRESRSAGHRNRSPHRYFMTANLCIKRQLLLDHPFDQRLSSYGYEDIHLGSSLMNLEKNILHIENPVLHKGLKKAADFLADQQQASDNLAQLYLTDDKVTTKLLSRYHQLDAVGLKDLIIKYVSTRADRYEKELLSGKISLKKLDLLKLFYLDRSLFSLKKDD